MASETQQNVCPVPVMAAYIYIGPPLAFVLVIFVEIIGTKYTKCVIQCLSGLSTKVVSHSGRGADK